MPLCCCGWIENGTRSMPLITGQQLRVLQGTMLLASLNSLFQACYMLYAWNKEAFEPPVIKQDLPRAFVFVISALVTELCNVFVMQHFVYRKWQTNVWWALRILDGFSSFSWCVLVVLIVLAFNVQQPYMVMNFGIHS